MQVNRMQNQPNFKAKVDIMNAKKIAEHLETADVKRFVEQRRALRTIGDKNLSFSVGYTPQNLGPFMILAKQRHHRTTDISVKFEDGLHLSDLAKKAREMHKAMSQELRAEPVYPKSKKTYSDTRRDAFEING